MSKHNHERRQRDTLIVTSHPEANYHDKVMKLAQNNSGLFQPGKMTQVIVAHDDWCDMHHGGACNCDPEVKLAADEPQN